MSAPVPASSLTSQDPSVVEAIEKARRAATTKDTLRSFTQAQVDSIVEAVARAAASQAVPLAVSANRETGFGNADDKTAKNRFASERVAEYIRPLKTVGIVREDEKTGITEIAEPMGVMAAVIPSTNPTSTAIFKAIIGIKARCPVVLSPHPSARQCVAETFQVVRAAAIQAGLPDDALQCLETVSIAGTEALMKARDTSVILATGGIGLVRAAYASGKPAYGVGPGNVPVYLHSSANTARAVRDVIAGKTFDYGTLCSSEQALVYDRPLATVVRSALDSERVHVLSADEAEKVARCVVTERFMVNPKMAGRSAQAIADASGIKVASGTRALAAPLTGVGRAFPLSIEKLCPVIALYEVDGPKEGISRCRELLSFGGTGHTCGIHAADEDLLREFALAQPASRVIANSQTSMGATGATTSLAPSMSLGCGAAAGNITSDNITPLHLVNIKRLARSKESLAEAARAAQKAVPGVDFVCEDDVRRAKREGRKIQLAPKAIVTPAARDEAAGSDVLIPAFL